MNSELISALLADLDNPQAIVEELWIFRHWVMARCGRYSVVSIPEDTTEDLCRGDSNVADWPGQTVRRVVVEGLSSLDVVHRAAAMACLNAAVRRAPSAWLGNAMGPFADWVKREPSCFIGHFHEAERWRDAGHPVTIVELVPRPGDVHWRDADTALAQASLVFVTGLTLITGTFEQVVARTPNARLRVLMGPTVPGSARLLEHGAHIVGGTWVEDPPRLLRYFQYGGTTIRRAPEGAIRQFNIARPDVAKELGYVA